VGCIETADQATAAILDRSAYDRGFISNPFAGDEAARLGLRRTQMMLGQLGNPERDYAIVHVAGSKGKGSTCVFIDAILRAAGHRTGRYLSPHLHSHRERFVVDDRDIASGAFTALTADLIAVAERIEATDPGLGKITAFELTTAMALRWFQQSGCDVAVVEVGLGGTLDATNVVDPAVAVITPLDFEHTAVLGTTMAEIAGNKAGIIKRGRPVVSAAQPEDGLAVIRERADAANAPLLVAGRDWRITGTDRAFSAAGPWGTISTLRVALEGRHQVDNAGLAIAAVHLLAQNVTEEAVRAGLRSARLPGRFELIALPDGRTVVLDGAHTPASTRALATALHDRFPGEPVTAVFGMLRDKDPGQVIAPLLPLIDRWVAVSPDTPRALPAEAVAAAILDLGAPCTPAATVGDGIATALAFDAPVVLVTGSLGTVGDAREALGLVQRRADP
jgi:dihydrofolate synthase / folylpolyglutamate synthase